MRIAHCIISFKYTVKGLDGEINADELLATPLETQGSGFGRLRLGVCCMRVIGKLKCDAISILSVYVCVYIYMCIYIYTYKERPG